MLYILLAAYNEEKDLPKVLAEIKSQNWAYSLNVVIVNDGSNDNTLQIAEEYKSRLPITIISHSENKGLGCALLTGLKDVSKKINNNDILITIDADGTHPIETIPDLCARVESGYDIVIASRFCPGGKQFGVPFYRRFLSKSANLIFRFVLSIEKTKDYTSGFRAFSGRIIKELFNVYKEKSLTETGFTATVELLSKTASLTNKVAEVPLTLYYNRKSGISKMKVIKTISRYMDYISNKLLKK